MNSLVIVLNRDETKQIKAIRTISSHMYQSNSVCPVCVPVQAD